MNQTNLSSEFRYLASLFDPTAAYGEKDQSLAPYVEWNRLLALADHNKLSAATRARLKNSDIDLLPPEIGTEIWSTETDAVIRSLAMEQATVEVYKLLEYADIASLVVKGVAGSALMGNDHDGIHFSSDVDILLSPDDFDRAESVLKSAGYRPDKKNVSFDNPSTRSLMMELSHAHIFEDPRLGVEIDLHHRLLQNAAWMDIPFADLFDRSQAFQIDGHIVRTLGDADQELYLLLHMLDHDRLKLKWVVDAARAIHRANSPNINRIDHVPMALSVSRSLLKKLYPNLHMQAGEKHEQEAEILLREMDDLSGPQPSSSFAMFAWQRFAQFCRRCVWGGSLRATRIEITRTATDPSDVERLGLGKSWWPLYVLIGPVFIFLRYLKRKREMLSQSAQTK